MERNHITLQSIDTSHSAYPFTEALWLAAFPPEERRDILAQRRNVDRNARMRLLLIRNEERPIGLLTLWSLPLFFYCEHFALDTSLRGQGLGSVALRMLLQAIRQPLVLEVEPPVGKMEKKRVEFYQRQGLVLWKRTPYVQPPYHEGSVSLPLCLMATADLNERRDFPMVRRDIHHFVYGLTNP